MRNLAGLIENLWMARSVMNFIKCELAGVVIVEPDVFRDDRGFFLETYHAEKYWTNGINVGFVQDNHSRSCKNTIRGLHAQRTRPQGKLVRALSGTIFDVVVDIRRGSVTYLKWLSVELSADNFRQIYIPPGFAHGICVLSDFAEIEYKCTDFYNPADELRILWRDPQIGIAWPIREPILSSKDQAAASLSDQVDKLPILEGSRPVG
jgi:dTDP-4-dehydrorhamnose 3,5-epimerase